MSNPITEELERKNQERNRIQQHLIKLQSDLRLVQVRMRTFQGRNGNPIQVEKLNNQIRKLERQILEQQQKLSQL